MGTGDSEMSKEAESAKATRWGPAWCGHRAWYPVSGAKWTGEGEVRKGRRGLVEQWRDFGFM